MWLYDCAGVLLAVVAVWLWWRRRVRRIETALERAQAENRTLQDRRLEVQREAEARELALLNNMVEGVLLLDSDGRVRLSNRAMNVMFGVRYDIRGQTLLEAFRLDVLQDVFRRVLTLGTLVSVEVELSGEDSRLVQVNAHALVDRLSRREGVVFECRDLTRLRQLENTRRDFVANVSHELRTPLSLIKGFTETLLQGAKSDAEVTERFLRNIEKHADRLTFLIEDLLTLSRLESGQIVMNTQPRELLPLVREVLVDLEPRVMERGMSLENLVDGGVWVQADGDRLQQALTNLIDNAVKYGKLGGHIRLESVRLPDRWVRVQVSDDGPGISPQALPRVFERFYRADKARSREQGGTGLGLAIVKHIVQVHGGEVWVESHPGVGTTFFFTLPEGVSEGDGSGRRET